MHYAAIFTVLFSTASILIFALLNGEGANSGVSVAQLIAAIAALAAVIGFLWRAAQKTTQTSQVLLTQQLKKSDERLADERKAMNGGRRAVLQQLYGMCDAHLGAHRHET